MNNMISEKQKKELKELAPQVKQIRDALFSVKHFGVLPKGSKSYAFWEQQGLMKMRKKRTTSYGKKLTYPISEKIILTKKGKKMLGVLE